MFNDKILGFKIMPLASSISAVLVVALLTTLTSAAQAETTNDMNNMSARSAEYCSNINQVTTSSFRYKSNQQRTIDCLLPLLHNYQQSNMTKRQQYFAYKAQAWLNYAYHEDSIKSQTAAGTQALQTGIIILQALQADEDLGITTDIPSTSALMRPDLWAILVALKSSGGIDNAPREVAFSEVALVWAAADQCEHGWRQSSSHFRMADRWLEQAREAYVNNNDSQTNVALEELINNYYKQFAPLDPVDDICQGQVFISNE